jgi:hypothetical protein
MKQKDASRENLEKITLREIHKHHDDIHRAGVPVWRENAQGNMVILRDEMLNQLFEKGAWDRVFYIQKGWEARIPEEEKQAKVPEPSPPPSEESPATLEDDQMEEPRETGDGTALNRMFQDRMDKFSSQTHEEKTRVMDKNIDRIRSHIENPEALPQDIIKECIKIVTDFFMINLTSVRSHETEELNDEQMADIVSRTESFIDEIITLLRKENLSYRDLNLIEKMSIKSPTFDHISKVFLRFILFGFFFDSFFRDGRIDRILNNLAAYEKYYDRIQQKTHALKLSDTGIKRIRKTEMKRYALGVLLHDVGKFLHIDYHEGNMPYSREKVVGHAALGYNMLVKSRVIPQDMAAMSALHHEYYGHPSGYGVSKFLFPVVREKMKASSPYFPTYMSMNFEDVKNARSMAFLPAKMLEIHDVFDGLTNKSRPNPKSIGEAINIMRQEMIEEATKLDPILFDIFVEFMAEYIGTEKQG